MALAVELRALSKHFRGGDVHAVDGVDLATSEGEYLVLLGPSGCGKTTLLRTIAGLEEPTEGEVLIGGSVVNGLPPRARKIAMVFQSYALYPHMTVYNNIAFPLKAAKLDKAEQKRKIEWASSILGIDLLLHRRPRQLSGGQRQRVALARALVRDPDVFLLDEPLSNLDAQRRASARDELQHFQRDIGTTTIYVTHDQVEAMGMGDRIAVIDQGRVRQVGTPREIYDEPSDTFVATFLGSPPMNLVPRNGELLGFRPEHFTPVALAAGGEGSGDEVTLPVRVTRDEYLGAERLIYGEVGETKVVTRLPATTDIPVAPGQTHSFGVARHHLKVFDRTTGLRRDAARGAR